ncbi:MAG: hypothetical protein H7Y88_00350 [Phycisphaerales bacterium]|nr:hypothetical protein [Phycisphaerales bacterium]
MKIGPSLAPTNPFHIARAYGAAPSRAPESAGVAPASFDTHGPLPKIDQLVAATVPGRVEFGADGVPVVARREPLAAASGAYQMYGRPADRNAAATAIVLGQVVDVNG